MRRECGLVTGFRNIRFLVLFKVTFVQWRGENPGTCSYKGQRPSPPAGHRTARRRPRIWVIVIWRQRTPRRHRFRTNEGRAVEDLVINRDKERTKLANIEDVIIKRMQRRHVLWEGVLPHFTWIYVNINLLHIFTLFTHPFHRTFWGIQLLPQVNQSA